MAKFSLGDDGMKGFLAQQGEKFVFGVVLLVAFYLVYSGSTVSGYPKVPQELKQLAQQATTYVTTNDPAWVTDEIERNPFSNYEERADKANIEINARQYPFNNRLKHPLVPRTDKRDDPKIFPPLMVEVSSIGQVAVAVPNKNRIDAFANDETTKQMRTDGEPKPRGRRSRRRRDPAGGGVGPPGGDGGLGGFGLGGAGGLDGGGDEAGGLGADGAGDGELGGMDGAPGSGSSVYRGPTRGGWESSLIGGAVSGALGIRGYSVNVVAVRALVPYEKQSSEFEQVFLKAVNYKKTRDTPNYIAFSAERAEVSTADPDAPLKWVSVWSTKKSLDRVSAFIDVYPDSVSSDFALPNTTMRVPPIMLANVRDHISHSEFPKLQSTKLKDASEDDKSKVDPNDPFGDSGSGDIPGSGQPSGSQGIPGGAGLAPPGGAGGLGPPGAGGLGAPGAGGLGAPGAGGLGAPGAGGLGAPPGAGGYAGSGGLGTDTSKTEITKYKLIRFFDFGVVPGKTYKYRVQLLIEDPNHPKDSRMQPAQRDLKSGVLTRLKALSAKEASGGSRAYFHRTEWSEPSASVSIAYPQRVLPGVVTTPTGWQTENRTTGVKIETRESKVKIVAVTWDKNRAVDVPLEIDVARGAVVNFKEDAVVVHPVSHVKKLLKVYNLETNTVVLDYRGGEKINKDRDNPVFAPTEMLLLTPTGELVVRSEVDEAEEYRWLTRTDEARPSANLGGGLDGGGLDGGGLDGGGLGGGLAPPGLGGGLGN